MYRRLNGRTPAAFYTTRIRFEMDAADSLWEENPIVRFGRYRDKRHDLSSGLASPDSEASRTANPKENRASEALVACLDLSIVLRAAFLQLLKSKASMNVPADFWLLKPEDWRLHREYRPPEYREDRWDILIENGIYRIVIEVKVNDTLTNAQLMRYRGRLGDGFGIVFGLYAFRERTQIGIHASPEFSTLRWQEVVDALEKVVLSGTADFRLFRAFREFLQDEQIIMPHKVSNLAELDRLIPAFGALQAFFDRCRVIPPLRDREPVRGGNDQIRFSGKFPNISLPELSYVFPHRPRLVIQCRVEGCNGWDRPTAIVLMVESSGDDQMAFSKLKGAKFRFWVNKFGSWREDPNPAQLGPSDVWQAYREFPVREKDGVIPIDLDSLLETISGEISTAVELIMSLPPKSAA